MPDLPGYALDHCHNCNSLNHRENQCPLLDLEDTQP